jgi:hypothetical protein
MIEIDCGFPGGNVVVDEIEGDTVRVRPDVRDTEQHWFYWYFRVRGAEGRTLRFEFEEDDVGVRGPGISRDGGRTWGWLGAESGHERSFTYAFPEDVAEARFSFGMPYTQANLDAFLSERAGDPHLRASTLCQSRKGRAVESLSFGKLAGEPEHRVLLTARHHACEMMASYALEGLIDGVLAEDEAGDWLRDHVEFLAVPFMDKDGVEDGDQGKSRRPHDHNRDYAAPCLYPEVRALREQARKWSRDRLRMAFDLHCPGHRGDWHELIHFVGVPNDRLWFRVEQFCDVLEGTATGPLPYRTCNNLPFGVAWNTPDEYGSLGGEPANASDWLAALPGIWFGATLEIPYANAQGAEVNADTARSFGRDLARAIRQHVAQQLA